MNLIWVTRGRTWGFQFLRDGGASDPLSVYEEAFSGVEDEPEVWRRVGERVVLRFPDPLQRTDRAGRGIPHDFVVSGLLADQINSVEDGLRLVWPEFAGEYSRVWDLPKAPSTGR